MTLPAFKAVSTGHESSIAWPGGHAAGDFAMCFVEHSDGTVATPSGWTVIPGLPLGVASTTLSGFYRFATGGAESNFAISGPTNHAWGTIITYTGVNTLNPFHLIATNTQVSSTAKYWPGLQTFLNGDVVQDVNGIRIAGYSDPFERRSSDGYADRYRGPTPTPAMQDAFTAWLRSIQSRVDVIMVHEPALIEPALTVLRDDPPSHPLMFVVGHTHKAKLDTQPGVTVVNGGSIGGLKVVAVDD